jgi:hypothetical protein
MYILHSMGGHLVLSVIGLVLAVGGCLGALRLIVLPVRAAQAMRFMMRAKSDYTKIPAARQGDAKAQAASQEDTEAPVRSKDSSWRTTVLTLFSVTAVLAGLTILRYTHTSTNNQLSPADIFTDLSGAGTLIGGVAAMLVFATGYWDRRKRKKQYPNTEVLFNAIEHIGHALRPEDIHALADLARALNDDQDETRVIEAAARPNKKPTIASSNGSATATVKRRKKYARRM